LAILLARCPEASAWSIEEADAWWGRHERGQGPLAPAAGAPPTAANRYAAAIDQSWSSPRFLPTGCASDAQRPGKSGRVGLLLLLIVVLFLRYV
jgi:hypothetical protein